MLSKTGISGPSKSILIPVITILMSWMLAGGQAYGGPPSGEPSKSSAVIPEEEGTRPYCMPGELVVKLTVWDTTSIDIINEKFGTRVLEHLYQLRSYLLTTSPGTDSTTTDLEELAKQMRADPLVEAAHPN